LAIPSGAHYGGTGGVAYNDYNLVSGALSTNYPGIGYINALHAGTGTDNHTIESGSGAGPPIIVDGIATVQPGATWGSSSHVPWINCLRNGLQNSVSISYLADPYAAHMFHQFTYTPTVSGYVYLMIGLSNTSGAGGYPITDRDRNMDVVSIAYAGTFRNFSAIPI
jgi:hypothetical protein